MMTVAAPFRCCCCTPAHLARSSHCLRACVYLSVCLPSASLVSLAMATRRPAPPRAAGGWATGQINKDGDSAQDSSASSSSASAASAGIVLSPRSATANAGPVGSNSAGMGTLRGAFLGQAKVTELENEKDAKIASLQTELRAAVQRADAAEAQVRQLQRRLQELEARNATPRTDAAAGSASATDAARIEELTNKVYELEQELAAARDAPPPPPPGFDASGTLARSLVRSFVRVIGHRASLHWRCLVGRRTHEPIRRTGACWYASNATLPPSLSLAIRQALTPRCRWCALLHHTGCPPPPPMAFGGTRALTSHSEKPSLTIHPSPATLQTRLLPEDRRRRLAWEEVRSASGS